MSNPSHIHIVKFRTYVLVLLGLLFLTFVSVAVTVIELGRIAVATALILATIKASLVLWYFMHLKYENRVFRIMFGLVLFLFLAILIVTFLDYAFQA
jgi:cytochrome c oxidase subunit IV